MIFNFRNMSKQPIAQQFTIETATESDAVDIGCVHLQAMLETYPNTKAGIDESWIRQKLGFLVEAQGNEFRRQIVFRSETDPGHTLYLVVRNVQGELVGFFHFTRGQQQAKLQAIYLIHEARGKGIADELMQRGIEFADSVPITLEVLNYNQRAIRFYEKYGFEKVPDSNKILRERLPVFTMQRKPTKEIEL
jgi:ribosomal protein S18 acetylase RimI-like enzyme